MNDDNSETKTELLVVDDSKVIRWAASKILSKEYTVQEANDGQEAWQILQENEDIAAVFTDLQMKGTDGYELLKLIRSADDPRLIDLVLGETNPIQQPRPEVAVDHAHGSIA